MTAPRETQATVHSPVSLYAAAAKLGHPMGKRKTDPHLAQAVSAGLGRRPSPPVATGSLTEGLRSQRPSLIRRAWDALLRRSVTPRTSRRWYLRRADQLDQGATPWCVDATRAHWQRSVPLIVRKHHPMGELYAACKRIDGWPDEDGTSAHAMLQVCQGLGVVDSYWWWTGSQDDEAARRWLLDIGPMWVGLNLPESFFRTDDKGLVPVEGDLLYGHEMLLIGYDGSKKRWELANSWGNENWGLAGRGFVRDEDFKRLLHDGGDLIGVVEAKAA